MKEKIKRIALDEGAASVGVASVERLGDLPSMSTDYLLPGAKSIISLMSPLDGDIIHRYLGKEDRAAARREFEQALELDAFHIGAGNRLGEM